MVLRPGANLLAGSTRQRLEARGSRIHHDEERRIEADSLFGEEMTLNEAQEKMYATTELLDRLENIREAVDGEIVRAFNEKRELFYAFPTLMFRRPKKLHDSIPDATGDSTT